ncbi:hypothetical protein XH83_28650 [Bradyrhizobium sp. CCBAU 53351]|nr:hypothetical protein XH83_28650 [Bradyrhizobium sp. CCBAU 53351]
MHIYKAHLIQSNREDLHDFVAFADRTPALDDVVDDVLARYVLDLLEVLSASFDWVLCPDRSASQVKINLR